MIEIREVRSRRDLRRFVDFPVRLYRDNPCYVHDLRGSELGSFIRGKNPAYEYADSWCFLALRDGKVVGRIAAIHNRKANELWGQKRLRFSRFDLIEDFDVARALVGRVEELARSLDLDEVHGPMGFCDLDQEGMLVEGFNELGTFVTCYNHPYYSAFLERLGYVKDVDWVEYELTVPAEPDIQLQKLAEQVRLRTGAKVLNFKTPKEVISWAPAVFKLLDEAYKHLYGVVPLTRAQVQSYIDEFFSFINPDFIKVVVDEGGEAVGFGITFLSLARAAQKARGRLFPFGFIPILRACRKNDRLELFLVGVRPDYQNKGVDALLMDAITREALRYGVKTVETNPELEENFKVRTQWKFFQNRQHKRRRVYRRSLGGAAAT
jgi:GNAT superfamily N-acetyltransferase